MSSRNIGVSFDTPVIVGSSNVSAANGTHYWFPEVMLRLSPACIALRVDRCEYSGLCPLRNHPAVCEQIVVSTDSGATEFVDLYTAPPGLSLGRAIPAIGGAPKQTLTGSPAAPGFLQTWSASMPPTIEEKVLVTYSGIPPAFEGNRTCRSGSPCGLVGPSNTIVRTRGGVLLTAYYGTATDSSRVCTHGGANFCFTIAVVASEDGGRSWTYTSRLDQTATMPTNVEGPCEPTICELADGRLLIVFRLQNGTPLWMSRSSDGAQTWTQPRATVGVGKGQHSRITPHSVWPQLLLLSNGVLVLSSGRPGVGFWASFAGDGEVWQHYDVEAEHNQRVRLPEDRYALNSTGTSSYTAMLEIEPGVVLLAYDKGPCCLFACPDAPPTMVQKVFAMRIRTENGERSDRTKQPASSLPFASTAFAI